MIVRVNKKETPYVVLDVTALRDKNLSAQAKGLHAYLMTLPNDWKIRLTELANHFANGYTVIRSAFTELETQGYARKTRTNSSGKGDWSIVVYETPQTEDMIRDQEVKETAGKLPKKNTSTKTAISATVTEIVSIMPPHLQDPVLWRQWMAHRIAIKRPFTLPAATLAASTLKNYSIGQVRDCVNASIMHGWTGLFPHADLGEKTEQEQAPDQPVESGLKDIIEVFQHFCTEGEGKSDALIKTAAQVILNGWKRLPGSPTDPDTVKGHFGSPKRFCRALFEGVPSYVVLRKTASHMAEFCNKEEKKLGVSFKTGRGL